MITIEKVTDKKSLKAFVKFPFKLYRGNKYWVPPLIGGEMNTFDASHNPTLEFCDVNLLVAKKEGRIVGRIALIVNHRENDILGVRKMRFGWLDFEDDKEVTGALFAAAEDWAREKGMDYMEGPVGFCNLDKAAMLTFGFDELSNTTALYNYPYYESHMVAAGFDYCTQWVESEIKTPTAVPEKISRFSALIKEKYSLSIPDLRSKSAIKKYIPQVFDVLNKTYSVLENFVPLTEKQQTFYAAQFMAVINPEYVSCVQDKDGNMIAFGLAIPYMASALQKAGGSLLPFGWWHLLKAHKVNKRAELLLIGVLPEWQRKGVTALIFEEVMRRFMRDNIMYVESNPQQEKNTSVRVLWKEYESRHHKSRWTFIKHLK